MIISEISIFKESDLDSILIIENSSNLLPWNRDIFIDCLKGGGSAICIRENTLLNQRIIAYCIFLAAPDKLHIYNITVSPDFRRLGIAKILLNEIELITLKLQAPRIVVEVRESNFAAICLYQSLKYKKIHLLRGYYPNHSNSNSENALVMAKHPINKAQKKQA